MVTVVSGVHTGTIAQRVTWPFGLQARALEQWGSHTVPGAASALPGNLAEMYAGLLSQNLWGWA